MNEQTLSLSVFTPERSILMDTAVESIVLPGAMGQFNILPGHTNFITNLRYGVFGYRINGEWQIAFLSGGFTQVFAGKVTVLAETIEMAQELDLAQSEAKLQELSGKLRAAKLGTPEYTQLSLDLELVHSRLQAAAKKLH